jgi:hypothetical protein
MRKKNKKELHHGGEEKKNEKKKTYLFSPTWQHARGSFLHFDELPIRGRRRTARSNSPA